MNDKDKVKQITDKLIVQAEKATKIYMELFTGVGMNEVIAEKIAGLLADLNVMGSMFAQTGMPIEQVRDVLSKEFARYVESEPGVREEMRRVFSSDQQVQLFAKAAKIQQIQMMEEEIAKLKEEVAQPLAVRKEPSDPTAVVLPPPSTLQ